jgi:hypothetical protein
MRVTAQRFTYLVTEFVVAEERVVVKTYLSDDMMSQISSYTFSA